jgi:actin-like ATPase involved in cell morphogenesis
MARSMDCGTYNLVSCKRGEDGDFVYKREVNAFLELPLENKFVFNMMKQAGVPLIERENVAYALGERAVDMAYTMSSMDLKRPMTSGCVNPREKDAFQILSIMMHNLIGEVSEDKELLYYSVPSNAINEETDAEYHSKILEAIFKSYRSEKGYTVDPRPINEALAIVYSELAHKGYTGFGVSCGGGMVNICYAMFGNPIFTFSIVNSGDWIDKMAAKAVGESATFINKEKTKIDLSKSPTNLVERAIQTQYRIMVENTVNSIKKGLAGVQKNVRTNDAMDFVVSGGVASPPGFKEMFTECLMQADLPIKVGEIIKPKENLFSVAKGCLLAAEHSM